MPLTEHVCFISTELDKPMGGARMTIHFANLLIRKGHAVSMVILGNAKGCFFPADKKINFHYRDLHFGITEKGNMLSRKFFFYQHIRVLKRLIHSIGPDIIIATEYPIAIAAVKAGLTRSSKVISWEHTHFVTFKKNSFWQWQMKKAYPRLQALVCLNSDEGKYFENYNHHIAIIPYFVTLPEKPPLVNKENIILSIGHLNRVKGIDLLLQAAKIVFHKHPEWKWKIIGEIEQRDHVGEMLEDHGLKSNLVIQKPVSDDLHNDYEQASIFAHTARTESFGMVLLEAMSHGLPCVAFDCETGPRHIIQDGVTGVLIEPGNTEKFAEAIIHLIENTEWRRRLSAASLAGLEKFSPENIYNEWRTLFNNLDSNGAIPASY